MKLRRRQAARAAAVLAQSGLAVDSVMALGGGEVEIVAALAQGSGSLWAGIIFHTVYNSLILIRLVMCTAPLSIR